jgi:hypothetical protein
LGREYEAYVRPGNFANIEKLVVTPSNDAVLLRLLILLLCNLLREQPTSSCREGARFALVSVIRHLPARENPLNVLPVGSLDDDGVLGGTEEVLQRLGDLAGLRSLLVGTILPERKLRELIRCLLLDADRFRPSRLLLLALLNLLALRLTLHPSDDILLLLIKFRLVRGSFAEALELMDELGGRRGSGRVPAQTSNHSSGVRGEGERSRG